jgi:uncharacterized protein (DUF362 family)
MKKNQTENVDTEKQVMSRRRFLLRGLSAAGLSAVGAYLAFAPENFPFSLKDRTGLRSLPQPEVFKLKDFRVPYPTGQASVGIGRNGETSIQLRKALDAIGGIEHYIKRGDRVLIKPNVAFDRSPNLGATTHPDIIGSLTKLLFRDCGVQEVRVTDNPIESPADCFAKSGVRQAVERAGGRVFLPDTNAFKILKTPGANLIEAWPFFYRPFKDIDKVIGLAPVKDHNLCKASLGIKNWYGLLGGRRNQFHQAIHEIISDLSIMIKPTLTILDGTRVLMENGPTGGDPSNVKKGNVIIAGTDPVAVDAWAYRYALERGGSLPEYLYRSEKRGSGSTDLRGRLKEIA